MPLKEHSIVLQYVNLHQPLSLFSDFSSLIAAIHATIPRVAPDAVTLVQIFTLIPGIHPSRFRIMSDTTFAV